MDRGIIQAELQNLIELKQNDCEYSAPLYLARMSPPNKEKNLSQFYFFFFLVLYNVSFNHAFAS